MVNKRVQTVSASQACRQRMLDARNDLPNSIGQQAVMEFVVKAAPHLNQLTYATRWHNAWLGRVADPELTDLVELAAKHFKAQEEKKSSRLRRQQIKMTN